MVNKFIRIVAITDAARIDVCAGLTAEEGAVASARQYDETNTAREIVFGNSMSGMDYVAMPEKALWPHPDKDVFYSRGNRFQGIR
ncbi:hypothetical protein LK540_24630 [Massilia sp. IC2-278]|uniref:hypothetical protein n=1 Tax=Massilia sp. IC2-278 TaxID=2887200 RepID=UPI001E65579F|nr:hypothetical protein [Massilia sp. IC2-278]MCC2963630.1 hypothetical protein [Massilia sp. IC2-278]